MTDLQVTPRACRDAGDVEAVVQVASAAWRAYGPRTYFHPGDIWWRARGDWLPQVRLWDDAAGKLAAFSAGDASGEYELQVHPRFYGCGVEAQIAAWYEQELHNAAVQLSTWASEGDAEWIEFLTTAGYRRTDGCCLHLLMTLDREIEPPTLPEGFAVRGVTGEQEVEARVAVHRAAFDPSPLNVERYLRVMRMPGYRPELDVVATAPDGTLAAFCLCWYDAGSRTGELEPVGTHPDYRRLGLGRTVVLEGLRQLREVGSERVLVVTGDDGEAGRLYERCGFEIDRRDYLYARTAAPGV